MGTSSQKLIVLKELVGNTPMQLDAVQQFLLPYVGLIHDFWISLWCFTLIVVIVKLFLDYRKYRKEK